MLTTAQTESEPQSPASLPTIAYRLLIAALVLAAIWLRLHLLGNVPGCNGDEAWYGVGAWQATHGGPLDWRTPTGNPINGFFFLPMAALHAWLPPSITLLRSVAVASGLAALAVNWLLCRWVFDRRTAAISTTILAILPINIAYSRFAWDASQSLAATLPVLYFSLAAVRRHEGDRSMFSANRFLAKHVSSPKNGPVPGLCSSPARRGRWIAAAVVAQLAAVWVHPTNIFAGAAIVAAVAAGRRTSLTLRGCDLFVGCVKRTTTCFGWCVSRTLRMARGGQSDFRGGEAIPHDDVADTAKIGTVPGKKYRRWWIALTAVLVLLAGFWAVNLANTPLPGRIAQRIGGGLGELVHPSELPHFSVLYARLFTGGTIYRYIAGSRSWFEWPLPESLDGWGCDVGVFWAVMLAAAWLVWSRGFKHYRTPHAPREAGPSPQPHAEREEYIPEFGPSLQPHAEREEYIPEFGLSPQPHAEREEYIRPSDQRPGLDANTDRVLLTGWGLQLAAFLLVAGPRAMAPGEERFAICLIGPAVLLASRGAALAYEAARPRWRIALAGVSLAGWLMVADFHEHYFRFIERTGGQAHRTFFTGPIEPKQAALQYILQHRSAGPIEIRCSEWWNRWPIEYLALSQRDVVVSGETTPNADAEPSAMFDGPQTWYVEFVGTEAEKQAEGRLTGRHPQRAEVLDYGGRPVLSVLHGGTE